MSRQGHITGVVTHVQRFSVHDGPGIRTTVFLKGCQMRCPWCHNPETLRPHPELQVYGARCIGCGACVARCEHAGREMVDDRLVFDRRRCVACGRCAEACFAQALVLVGQTVTAQEVVDEVLADQPFYQSSGGGMTISGGEPLTQPEFALAILELCRHEAVHTAVETNLGVPWACVERLAPAVDLFLVDVKLIDKSEHQRWTGVSNRHTLENLRRLDALGKPLVVRTPVIGGVNDRPEQIASIADWLTRLSNLREYELLPYHPLGSGKYEALGLPAPGLEFHTPSPDHMQRLAAAARRGSFAVSVAGAAVDRSKGPAALAAEQNTKHQTGSETCPTKEGQL